MDEFVHPDIYRHIIAQSVIQKCCPLDQHLDAKTIKCATSTINHESVFILQNTVLNITKYPKMEMKDVNTDEYTIGINMAECLQGNVVYSNTAK